MKCFFPEIKLFSRFYSRHNDKAHPVMNEQSCNDRATHINHNYAGIIICIISWTNDLSIKFVQIQSSAFLQMITLGTLVAI